MPGVDKNEMTCRVNDLVYFFISQVHKQTLIKRSDIIKHVMKDLSRSFDVIFKEAVFILNQKFGFDVIYIDKKKSYIVVNKMHDSNLIIKISKQEKRELGLIFLILSHIHNSGGVVTEDSLWNFLGLYELKPDVVHPVFGDVRDFVFKKLIHQAYLDVTTVDTRDPPTKEIRMGARATHELNHEKFARINLDLEQTKRLA